MIQCSPTTYYYVPLPLTLRSDGGADLIMRKVEIVGDQTVPIDSMQFNISPEELSVVLDSTPSPGMTRRDDLVNQIYEYVLSTGRIVGTIL